jgi:signal peptidase II
VEFSLAENPGAFLSLGSALPNTIRGGLFTIGVAVGLTILLIHLLRSRSVQWPWLIGLMLAWAGGASNLLDRLTRDGLVTDFILLRVGPLHTGVFNLADMAIMLGIAIVFWNSLRSHAGVHPANKASE